jgi:hypothetical protein
MQHIFIATDKCQLRFPAVCRHQAACLPRAITKVLHMGFFPAASLKSASDFILVLEVLRGSYIQ